MKYSSPEIRRLAKRLEADRTPAPAAAKKAARGPSPERIALVKAIEEREELRKRVAKLERDLRRADELAMNLGIQLERHHDEALKAAQQPLPEPPVFQPQPIHIEPQISVTMPDELRTIPAATETIAERDKDGLVKRSITRALGAEA
jgi:hypothetical protein